MNMGALLKMRFGSERRKMEGLEKCLDFLVEEGMYPNYRPISSSGTMPEVTIDGRQLLMFCDDCSLRKSWF